MDALLTSYGLTSSASWVVCQSRRYLHYRARVRGSALGSIPTIRGASRSSLAASWPLGFGANPRILELLGRPTGHPRVSLAHSLCLQASPPPRLPRHHPPRRRAVGPFGACFWVEAVRSGLDNDLGSAGGPVRLVQEGVNTGQAGRGTPGGDCSEPTRKRIYRSKDERRLACAPPAARTGPDAVLVERVQASLTCSLRRLRVPALARACALCADIRRHDRIFSAPSGYQAVVTSPS